MRRSGRRRLLPVLAGRGLTLRAALPEGEEAQVAGRQPRVPRALDARGLRLEALEEDPRVRLVAKVLQGAPERRERQGAAAPRVQGAEGMLDGAEGGLRPLLEALQDDGGVEVYLVQRYEARHVPVERSPDSWQVLDAQGAAGGAEALVGDAVGVVAVDEPPPRNDQARVVALQQRDEALPALVVRVRAEPGRGLPPVEEGGVLGRDGARPQQVAGLVQHCRDLSGAEARDPREAGEADRRRELVARPRRGLAPRPRGELLQRRDAAAVLLGGPLLEGGQDHGHLHVDLPEQGRAVVVDVHGLPECHHVAAESYLAAALQELDLRHGQIAVQVQGPPPAADEAAAGDRADPAPELPERLPPSPLVQVVTALPPLRGRSGGVQAHLEDGVEGHLAPQGVGLQDRHVAQRDGADAVEVQDLVEDRRRIAVIPVLHAGILELLEGQRAVGLTVQRPEHADRAPELLVRPALEAVDAEAVVRGELAEADSGVLAAPLGPPQQRAPEGGGIAQPGDPRQGVYELGEEEGAVAVCV
mmetsp:Transcript_60179/g.189014  ORF Transcript_60179/g.189014 Transcript_60179/m.189014 type:complete len:530 (+) Transcript_60179:416-2005(+)